MIERGDWVVYTYRHRGVLRSLTGVVLAVTEAGMVTFRSDGGQPKMPSGTVMTVPQDELRLSESPFAPKNGGVLDEV